MQNVIYDFKGGTAVVTGAGSGIARCIAENFAIAGANVVVADLNEAGGNETVELCKKHGVDAIFVKTNVAEEEDADNLYKETMAKFGRADYMVFGAGVNGRGITGNPLTGANVFDFDMCYNVNLKGIFLPAKAFYDHFKERKSGKMVIISSISGTHPSPHLPHYSASKAAAIQLAKIIAMELGPYNINVNTVCPGFVDTPMYEKARPQYIEKYPEMFDENTKSGDICRTMAKNNCPSQRPQTTQNMADAVMFLCSDAASEIMGQVIEVAGGFKL